MNKQDKAHLAKGSQQRNSAGPPKQGKRKWDDDKELKITTAYLAIGKACSELNATDSIAAIKMFCTIKNIPAFIGFPNEGMATFLEREKLEFSNLVAKKDDLKEETGRIPAPTDNTLVNSTKRIEVPPTREPRVVQKTGHYWDSDPECARLYTEVKEAQKALQSLKSNLAKTSQKFDPECPAATSLRELTAKLTKLKAEKFPEVHSANQAKGKKPAVSGEEMEGVTSALKDSSLEGAGSSTPIQAWSNSPGTSADPAKKQKVSHPNPNWNRESGIRGYEKYYYAGFRRDTIIDPRSGEMFSLINVEKTNGKTKLVVLGAGKYDEYCKKSKFIYLHFKQWNFDTEIPELPTSKGVWSEATMPKTFKESEFKEWGYTPELGRSTVNQ